MKRRTFISLMGVMAAAGVLSLTGCSSKDTAASTASSAPLNKLDPFRKILLALSSLADDSICNCLRNLNVVAGFHYILTTTLCLRAQIV